jgi:hypothetical protein
MKRTIGIALAVAFAIFGSMLSSGDVRGPGLIIGSTIFGALFGGIGALAYLGDRPDYVTRIGTVVILFLGGVAVFTSRATAVTVVPSATAGLLVGFSACLAYLGLSQE